MLLSELCCLAAWPLHKTLRGLYRQLRLFQASWVSLAAVIGCRAASAVMLVGP